MVSSMVTLSIVLPTYNRGNCIKRFLKSLRSQSYDDWELIIVNDASKDGTPKIISKFASYDKRIHPYSLKKHRGLPAARNIGVQLSKGNLIFFGEDDIIFKNKDALISLMNTYFELKESYRVGAVGPRLLGSGYKWLNDVVKIGSISRWIYHNFEYDPGRIVEVPVLHSCSLISKKAFYEVGGFEERLYTGTYVYEEVDFYYRLRMNGYKLFFQPKSVIQHDHVRTGGCEKNNLIRTYYNEFRNSILFLSRFYGFSQVFRIFIYPGLRIVFPRKPL